MHLHPRAEKNLQGKVHLQAEQESILGLFVGRVRFGGGSCSFISFRPSFEGDDQKRSSLF